MKNDNEDIELDAEKLVDDINNVLDSYTDKCMDRALFEKLRNDIIVRALIDCAYKICNNHIGFEYAVMTKIEQSRNDLLSRPVFIAVDTENCNK